MYCGVGGRRCGSRRGFGGSTSHCRCCRDVLRRDLFGIVGGLDGGRRDRCLCLGFDSQTAMCTRVGSRLGVGVLSAARIGSLNSRCTRFSPDTVGKAVRVVSGVVMCGRSRVTKGIVGRHLHFSMTSLVSRLAGGKVHLYPEKTTKGAKNDRFFVPAGCYGCCGSCGRRDHLFCLATGAK